MMSGSVVCVYLFLAALAIITRTALGLDCYKCDSSSNKDTDPCYNLEKLVESAKTNKTFVIACNEIGHVSDNGIRNKINTWTHQNKKFVYRCGKKVMTSGDMEMVKRYCTADLDPSEDACKDTTKEETTADSMKVAPAGGPHAQTTVCLCSGDKCNGAQQLLTTSFLQGIVPIFLLYLFI